MSALRKYSLAGGVFYLLTFVSMRRTRCRRVPWAWLPAVPR